MAHPFSSRMQRTVALCCLVVGSASAADPPEFAVLLSKHCVTCHNSVDPKAGLDLTMRAKALQGGDGGVILPGKPDDSLLLSRIVDGSMPPERRRPSADRRGSRCVSPMDRRRCDMARKTST